MDKTKNEMASLTETTSKPTKKVKQIPVEKSMVLSSDPLNISPAEMKSRVAISQATRQSLTDYISANMVEGQDYGKIMFGGRESKNVLFKPGSEKFCSLFGLRPTFRSDIETLSMLGNKEGIVAFICELMTKDGKIVGEGRGVATITEKNWRLNNMVKICEKRAMVDAVLRSGGLSDFFSQDLDDDAGQSTQPEDKPTQVRTDAISQGQIGFLFAIMQEKSITKEAMEKYLLESYNTIGVENLNKKQASEIIDKFVKKYNIKPKATQNAPKEELPSVQVGEEEVPGIDDF